jgi:uncharacterized protein (TIGR02145 family)
MKSLILTTLSLLITLGTFAQAPDGFSYQAVIRDANSNLVTDKNIGVQISILKDSVTGIPVYTERHNSKTNQNGLLTLQVGNGTVTIGDFSFIDWSKTTFFIKTEIDLLGGTNYTQSGTSQLLSVPYALHAKTAETAENAKTAENLSVVNGLPGQQLKIDEQGVPKWTGEAFPIVSTVSISSVSATSVIVNINISSDGGKSVSSRGVVFNTSINPTISNSKKMSGSGTGSFSITLTDLTPNTTYYVRGFGTNEVGTGYGSNLTFTTLQPTIPIISTNSITSLTQNSAISGGVISSNGGSVINARGVVWNTAPNPTISDNKTNDGTGSGNFNSSISGLTPNTLYYLRSYATNSVGTAYGNELSFTTSQLSIPILSTLEVFNITSNSASSGGVISSNGGSDISAKGVVWSTASNPTLADSKTTDGTGSENYNSVLTALTPGITYYVRAYATNSTGTGYGAQRTFTTASELKTIANIILDSIGNIGTTTATAYANIIDEGGGTITERGIVWNTQPLVSASINTRVVSSGSGIGSFVTIINSGIGNNRTYYVRAYAVNRFGVSYSNELQIRTITGLATLTTIAINSYSETATSGGNITDDGGSAISARGVVWSTNPNPTISDSKTVDGAGIGAFSSRLTELNPKTDYYVRAYATNSFGTAYGNEILFTTKATPTTVTDIDGNIYNTVQIGEQEWMAENLKTTRYRTGAEIPYVLANEDWSNLKSGAWCYFDHNETNNALYGKLYNGYTIQGDSLCPTGWHVPTIDEWRILINYLGGGSIAAKKLKEVGTTFWYGNIGATNESAFSARGGGFRESSFSNLKESAGWWSSTSSGNNINRTFQLDPFGFINYWDNFLFNGLSIRCLKN